MATPNFLGIGAQKAGTSWLHHHLKQHPEIWLPPMKELQYFNDEDHSSLLRKIILRKGEHRQYLHKLRKVPFNRTTLRYAKWYFKYFTHRRNDHNYKFLFNPDSNQIAGEITPAYSKLNLRAIKRIYQINPSLKAIFILRDPVERAISQLRMRMRRKSIFDNERSFPEAERFEAYLNSSYIYDNGNYLPNINKWLQYFPKNQLLILFFDDLRENPKSFLIRVLTFLEVDTSIDFTKSELSAKRGSFEYHIPDYVIERVKQMNLKNIESLHQKFNNEHTHKWLQSVHSRTKNFNLIDSQGQVT